MNFYISPCIRLNFFKKYIFDKIIYVRDIILEDIIIIILGHYGVSTAITPLCSNDLNFMKPVSIRIRARSCNSMTDVLVWCIVNKILYFSSLKFRSCLLQHCSQQLNYGSQDAPVLMNELRKCDIYIQWNFIWLQKRIKFCHLQVNGWNWRTSS
jgi:hypothetical protein